MPFLLCQLLCLLLLCATAGAEAGVTPLPAFHRILFLGDSITYSGQYVDDFEAFLFTRYPEKRFEVINVGLPSETVAGLSEPRHGGGKFPRPALHERLDRILLKTRPDLVFACYGMNDGLYQRVDKERFARFREGIGLLRKKVIRTGAVIIHLTPPAFDPGPFLQAGKFNYDQTLGAYSKWLLAQRSQGWHVIDFHGAMNRELTLKRAANPRFRFARDGVHPDSAGHWVLGRELWRAFNNGAAPDDLLHDRRYAKLLNVIHARGRILCDAWLRETGHRRPEMKTGLPLNEAKKKAARLELKIRQLSAAITHS
ncbi:MAG: family lipolytic protein [Chthoniobacteraceae bacterium]|nr:family lipolytic protein [Chthoniobacteraceae bacterium]